MTEVRLKSVKSVPFKELEEGEWFYFQNNYYLKIYDQGFRVSTSEYRTIGYDDEVTPLNADITFSYA